MNILLHICCGPCSVYPVKVLRQQGYRITGRFYNPNIHPYKEFKKRLNTLEKYARDIELPLIIEREYGLTEFLRNVVFNEQQRCKFCYEIRLEDCAKMAAEKGFPAFSSTLFYSKYQNHQLMRSVAERMAAKYGVEFVYHDFREGWQEGIDISIKEEMYRQPYCGCIYSEQERYDKSLRKKKRTQSLSNQDFLQKGAVAVNSRAEEREPELSVC